MSRIGNAIIEVPEKVTVNVKSGLVEAKGPKGTLSYLLPDGIELSNDSGKISLKRTRNDLAAMHGLARSLVANMVQGVSTGFVRDLEINGVGYRAEVKGKELVLSLGYSHPINFSIPEGISIKVDKQTAVKIEGADKQQVGEVAACIRRLRPPEPYKGKGIKYSDETIIRKAGKTAG